MIKGCATYNPLSFSDRLFRKLWVHWASLCIPGSAAPWWKAAAPLTYCWSSFRPCSTSVFCCLRPTLYKPPTKVSACEFCLKIFFWRPNSVDESELPRTSGCLSPGPLSPARDSPRKKYLPGFDWLLFHLLHREAYDSRLDHRLCPRGSWDVKFSVS